MRLRNLRDPKSHSGLDEESSRPVDVDRRGLVCTMSKYKLRVAVLEDRFDRGVVVVVRDGSLRSWSLLWAQEPP